MLRKACMTMTHISQSLLRMYLMKWVTMLDIKGLPAQHLSLVLSAKLLSSEDLAQHQATPSTHICTHLF